MLRRCVRAAAGGELTVFHSHQRNTLTRWHGRAHGQGSDRVSARLVAVAAVMVWPAAVTFEVGRMTEVVIVTISVRAAETLARL